MSLKQRIASEIAAEGPMPFEQFMTRALYDAEGFFGGNELRSQKAGDFLTSPEVSPLFGEMLAGYVAAERDRIGDPFQVIEVGAGSGSLMAPLLQHADVDAIAIDISPAARDRLSGLVPVAETLPSVIRGVVLANELLDNMPMAVAQKVDGSWRERWVGRDDDGLCFVDAEPREEVREWLESYAGPVADGGWVEVQLEARTWVADVVARLEAGSLVLFDYGETAEGLAHRRSHGTLRTYRAHHLGPHPLEEPGETDITADVNFSALLDIATPVRLWRQDDFLTEIGLRDRLRDLRRAELEAVRSGDEMRRLRLRTSVREAEALLHPRGLGDFRVFEYRARGNRGVVDAVSQE